MPQLFGPLGRSFLSSCFHGEAGHLTVNRVMEALEESGEYASPEIAVALVGVNSGRREPLEVFEEYSGSSFSVKHKRIEDFLSIHYVSRHILDLSSGGREVTGYIAVLRYLDMSLVLTTRRAMEQGTAFTDFRDHCLLEWVDRFYPDLDVMRIPARSLIAFLHGLDQARNSSLLLRRSTIRFPGGGFQRTEKVETLDSVLARLDDESGYLDRVTFHLDRETGYIATLARDGLAMYHSGSMGGFLHDLNDLLSDTASRKDVIRQVLEAQHGPYPPAFDIRFSRPISLTERNASQGLVELLEENQLYTVTVLHGNPYLHIAVTDLAHGSSYTIFSHKGDGLRVYPGVSADESALDHLISWISDRFSDVAEVSLCSSGLERGGTGD